MQKLLITLAGVLATLSLTAPRLAAQCAPPDGLDNLPCCTDAQLVVPRPKFAQDSLGICWRDCDVDSMQNYTAQWSALFPGLWTGSAPPCGWFTARLRLIAGGALHWSGSIRLSYARTWVETDSAGDLRHVWRFLANGDLRPTAAAGPIPCPVPPCVPATGNRARFTGYVDYAYSCSTGIWENAWMLTHGCDALDHVPGFPRGGAFHPDRSYTFVGPSMGFVPSALLPVESGGSTFESIRAWKVPPPGTTGAVTCLAEERIATASIQPVAQQCQCGPASAPGQFVEAGLFASGACGTLIQTAPGQRFVSMAIGSWTDPSIYPGPEQLRWSTGEYQVVDACSGVTANEIYFGVSTFGGFPANQYLQTGIGAPLPPVFVDQATSKLLPAGLPVRNVPYLSDRVFSLNL